MFLKKQKEPSTEMFDDDEWIRSLTEAEAITADTPQALVTYVAIGDNLQDQSVDPKRVRPIQMGEFVRKYVSRRLLALSEGENEQRMTQ